MKVTRLIFHLQNGVGGEGDAAGKSRFSQFFSVDSSGANVTESRRSSVQDDAIIKNLLKDMSDANVINIPGDSNSYFAPISPAANTMGANATGGSAKDVNNIMEMLHGRGKNNEKTRQLHYKIFVNYFWLIFRIFFRDPRAYNETGRTGGEDEAKSGGADAPQTPPKERRRHDCLQQTGMLQFRCKCF